MRDCELLVSVLLIHPRTEEMRKLSEFSMFPLKVLEVYVCIEEKWMIKRSKHEMPDAQNLNSLSICSLPY